MVFVAKKPHLYIPDLQQPTTDLINVGLYFGTSISEEQAQSWRALAQAIRQTSRSVRCLWLRFAVGDESAHSTLRAFGEELVGCATVQSLILENNIGIVELLCLKDWLVGNTALRGIKFLRTNLDVVAFVHLHDFFARNDSLKVLDVFGNNGVGDEAIKEILGAMLEGRAKLETLNIGETNFAEDVEGVARGTESGVQTILSYVRRTASIAHLKIRLHGMTNTRVIELANILHSPNCNISRLELGGRFGDDGVEFLAETLKTNRTLKTITIGVSEDLSDRGGRMILQACKDVDGMGSWNSVVVHSNHTLRSVFISEKHAPRMSEVVLTQLQSLTTEDPQRTLQSKAWKFIQRDMSCLPNLSLHMRHMPRFLAFVQAKGGQDSLFDILRAGYFRDLFTSPTPEKLRLKKEMVKIERENETLRTSLEREILKKQSILFLEKRKEKNSKSSCKQVGLPHEEDDDSHRWHKKRKTRQCCLQPYIKAFEVGQMMFELLKEIYRI